MASQRRRPLCLLLTAGVLLGAPTAAHAAIDEKGAVLISAERLFGISNSKTTLSVTNLGVTNKQSQSRTDFSVLASSPSNAYAVPRLALDVLVANSFTVGGALGFASGSGSSSITRAGTTTGSDSPDTTAILLAPRAGFAKSFGGRTAVWARAGLTYLRSSTENASETVKLTAWTLALNLEPNLVVMATDSFGFNVGLIVDLPLTGKQEQETRVGSSTTSVEVDYGLRNLGLMIGLIGKL